MKTKSILKTILLHMVMALLLTFLTPVTVLAEEVYITDVMLVGSTSPSRIVALLNTYKEQGWIDSGQNLNAGNGTMCDYIYLLYKTDTSNNINFGYITEFTICTGEATEEREFNHRTYHLVSYDGDSHFKSVKGDLNSNTIGEGVHLYYTKDEFDNSQAITGVFFNTTQSGAVDLNDNFIGYNINSLSEGSPLYMHTTTHYAYIYSITLDTGGTEYYSGHGVTFGSNYCTAESKAMAQNCQFYKDDNGYIGFRLDPDYVLFKSDTGYAFIGWGLGSTESYHNLSQLLSTKNTYTAQWEKWTYMVNPDGSLCYITGYDGNTAVESLTIPYTLDGAKPIGFSNMNFSKLTRLRTINFYYNTSIDELPRLSHTSIVHINTIEAPENSGYGADCLPPSIETIKAGTFAYSDIQNLILPNVTNVISGNLDVGAFTGCNNLEKVTFKKAATIGFNSFNTISGNCVVEYNGPIENWSHLMYLHSPNLIVQANNNNYCGSCCNWLTENYVCWSLINRVLTISCADKSMYDDNPNWQVIGTHPWAEISNPLLITSIILDHVYAINDNEFSYLNQVSTVYVNPTLNSIGENAFFGCTALEDLWFDGTEEQWNAVDKETGWDNNTNWAFKAHWHCTVDFDMNGHGRAIAAQTNLWSNSDKVIEPPTPTADGLPFLGWYTDANCTHPWDFNDAVPGNMTLYAKWLYHLDDDTNLANLDGNSCGVQLSGRTLYDGGFWNTLCLPFSLSTLDGTPLKDFVVKELDGENSFFSDGTLTLNFKNANSIEAGKPYLVKDDYDVYICSKADWDAFAERVKNGENKLKAKLMADITEPVTTMVGTTGRSFQGVFDGQGHTLTIAYGSEANPLRAVNIAPFVYVKRSTIKNLKVVGDIYTSLCWSSGLIGTASDGNTIQGCVVDVAIHSSYGANGGDDVGEHGGVVSTIFGDENIISDCAFTGSLLGPSTKSCGGFVGALASSGTFHINNCYFNPASVTMGTSDSKTFVRCDDIDRLYISNCYYTSTFGEPQGTATTETGIELARLLGDGWQVDDDQVVPKIIHENVNPTFYNVNIDATAPTGVSTNDGSATFIGTYTPVVLADGGDKKKLCMGADNTLHQPNSAMTIGSYRAYFMLPDGLFNSGIGDVNGDCEVNVTDVTLLVNHILGREEESFVIEKADIKHDGEVNVTDVTELVNLILRSSDVVLNVVVTGADGITFSGGGSGPARTMNIEY